MAANPAGFFRLFTGDLFLCCQWMGEIAETIEAFSDQVVVGASKAEVLVSSITRYRLLYFHAHQEGVGSTVGPAATQDDDPPLPVVLVLVLVLLVRDNAMLGGG